MYFNFVFPLIAVFVQRRRYINVHMSSSFLIIQHYMFRSMDITGRIRSWVEGFAVLLLNFM
jgi:hypothetical protein